MSCLNRFSVLSLSILALVVGPGCNICFFQSPGNLQGFWVQEFPDDDPADGVESSARLTYTICGESITRTYEISLGDDDSEVQVTLRSTESATFTLDESTSPARIDIRGIATLAHPSAEDINVAALILDDSRGDVEQGFEILRRLTLNLKGIVQRDGTRLRIRFDDDYPANFAPMRFELMLDAGFFFYVP